MWTSEREECSNYRSEVGIVIEGKVLNVWGMALTVHGAVFNCGECFGSGG